MRRYLLITSVTFFLFLLVAGCGPSSTIGPTPTLPTTNLTPSPTSTPAESTVPISSVSVGLELVAEGLTAPVYLTTPPDGSGRLFILDQTGTIHIVTPQAELVDEPFLDVSDLLVPLREQYDERGLLGLAFHPQFAQNGRFFIYYSAPLQPAGPEGWDHTDVLAEYRVSSQDPNRADPNSARIVLTIHHQRYNHDGGQILFGPDGYLYLGDGDGGGAGDPKGDAQNIDSLLGKVLRIDVDHGDSYSVPSDNPFVGREGADEIFAYGLRNPYRFSFDIDGRLIVADAGQALWEEVSIVIKGGNYGWDIKEGTSCFNEENSREPLATCPSTGARGEPLIDPIIVYDHTQGSAVIGGYVYRGQLVPPLLGRYIFGDLSLVNGRLFIAAPASEGIWDWEELEIADGSPWNLEGRYLLGLGQDQNSEIYVLTQDSLGPVGESGKVFRIIPAT